MLRTLAAVVAGAALAAGAYLAGSAVAHSQDSGAQHQLMGACVSGKTFSIDGQTYTCR